MRDFFKNVFATLTGLILFSVIGFGGLLFLVVTAALRDTGGPQVKDESVLTVDLSLSIADTEPASSTGEAIQRALDNEDVKTLALRDVVTAIEQAATDDRIVGLYLEGSPGEMPTGYANLVEVRNALETFRDSGKPILAHDRDWNEREYYLASVASELTLDPLGSATFNGLSSETAFLAGAFDRYGIGVQVVRVGEYKSAVEPFTRQNYSDENREQIQAYLTDLWTEVVQTVAEYRDLNEAQLRAIANERALLTAEEAVAQNFVDRTAYEDEIRTRLRELTNITEEDKPFRSVSLGSYIDITDPSEREGILDGENGEIAVIYAEGPIVEGEGGLQQIGGDRFARELRQLRLDEDIKAVVLRVNSPGGSAIASDVIKREVELLREQKPVIVSMGNVAASGGYWIAMAANEIIAQPNTLTGSIGVFGVLFNFEEITNENGITWDVVQTSPFANLNSAARPKTPQELALLQKFVNTIYQRFIQEVAQWRELPLSEVQNIARGRVWSGVAAENIGLVDRLGGLETAIQVAAEAAELGDDWSVREYPRVKSFEERVLEDLFGVPDESQLPQPLAQVWQVFGAQLRELASYNDPRGAYTRLPFTLQIE